MELAEKSVRQRGFDSPLLAIALLMVTALTDGGIQWTLIFAGVPVFLLLELLGDILGQRIREWRAS
ncbi:hypothetical protein [Halococcus sp. IIIV-5B]|uniref:hypothetical protein n=1 Tax=Halococcus sp. IIIV-5B TaxID=2321230 RepID=UPI000E707E2C|nr:hypothetical protein [Halococcus sp. IIIV-5B]RJT07934.1 hypothetical protein D3261_00875 [Halococcus sp. IIIV-5B]